MTTKRPDEALAALGELFKTRNAIYGDTYKDFGKILMGLFPGGVHRLQRGGGQPPRNHIPHRRQAGQVLQGPDHWRPPRLAGRHLRVRPAPPALGRDRKGEEGRDHHRGRRSVSRAGSRRHVPRRSVYDRKAALNSLLDPAAGSYSVMHAALSCGRNFLGCDLRG